MLVEHGGLFQASSLPKLAGLCVLVFPQYRLRKKTGYLSEIYLRKKHRIYGIPSDA
jgi:hypothetical protein